MMSTPRTPILVAAVACAAGVALLAVSLPSCRTVEPTPAAIVEGDLGTAAHADAVMSSRFCADCHPAIYAEHRQNTHGRAFFDGEARLATRGFRREDCIRCHTPRPVFETGIGMTPMTRWTDLEEGNTCMSCHGRAGYDYSRFVGGAQCKGAFEPAVATVNHCATCHRIAGTPDQWSRAEHGKLAGRECVDCHMPVVERPVAEGQPPRPVRSHLFPASTTESQLRRAYAYSAAIEGDHVVVRITNKGVGHNFPTANRQRSVESLVVVRDPEGNEIARSRLTCRYPYASELEPHQMTPPAGSQIPSGKTTEHRVPLTIGAGSVECRLYFKLYRPSADTDPALARCLEERRLPFDGVTPSAESVQAETEVRYPAAPTDLKDFLSVSGLANTARGPANGAPVVVPQGADAHERDVLAAMLESHLPEVRARARAQLASIYPESAEVLVASLARWSNESFNEACKVFVAVGAPAVPALAGALSSGELYVRCHARELLAQIDLGDARPSVVAALRDALGAENPLDRRSAAQALGGLDDRDSAALLRARLADGDWDVVHAAAASLAQLGDVESVPDMSAALARARWPETRRSLATSLAALGSGAGVQPLIGDLENPDELQREFTFEAFFAITGRHFGYEARGSQAERLFAEGRMQSWWTQGEDAGVRVPPRVDPKTRADTWHLVEQLGGGSDTVAGGDDDALADQLLAYGADAVPSLIEGLTFPEGYDAKRALCCRLLGSIGSADAAPFLAATLRDPSPVVAEWACWALESCGDADTPAQLRRFEDRVPALVGADRGAGPDAPADMLLARSARTRWKLGDERARDQLVGLLASRNLFARTIAITALSEADGDDRGFDPAADLEARNAAIGRWRTP